MLGKGTYFQPAAAWPLKRLCRLSEQAAITWRHSDHTHISRHRTNQTLGLASHSSQHAPNTPSVKESH